MFGIFIAQKTYLGSAERDCVVATTHSNRFIKGIRVASRAWPLETLVVSVMRRHSEWKTHRVHQISLEST